LNPPLFAAAQARFNVCFFNPERLLSSGRNVSGGSKAGEHKTRDSLS
jgi:hypothetical protein